MSAKEVGRDRFQAFLLREVLLAEGLQDDRQRAQLVTWVGKMVATPASFALDTWLGFPTGLGRLAIIGFTSQNATLFNIRRVRGAWSRVFRSKTAAAHSYCRTALCYALQGRYARAEVWLAWADALVGGLARPDFIRGLIRGARGQFAVSEALLRQAGRGRAKAATKARIGEALKLAARTSGAGPQGKC